MLRASAKSITRLFRESLILLEAQRGGFIVQGVERPTQLCGTDQARREAARPSELLLMWRDTGVATCDGQTTHRNIKCYKLTFIPKKIKFKNK